ncbi:tRNA glutamyl-Q(34) synthetase GluQRS [Methylocaldum szegediense]|uniref:Glutamyl-Q tRNA(Asp) synthetase n=1 Tax=Methylocaldum szegediense TaxID=73780 RepID=A0ABM9I8W5_9GAMM|nr:tRNA glutamyl-Q(34) synthetase GluQRS [Methylocaldum szegediense]CAI8965447.1 glutamyl-Q tRNA(Asp) synthetase [Methylocaldum szegediense]
MNDDPFSTLSSKPKYRGRFAPSPTGPLHLGSLYTALASFLQAKSQQGEWLLRIDDVDPFRTATDSSDRILRTLEAFGLHWDGPILYQSEQFEVYRAALERLDAQGLLYACTCSRKDLAALSDANAHTSIYPGFCRSKKNQPRPDHHALRILVKDTPITFEDALQGVQTQNLAKDVGDFVVFRRDRVYAYHLATVLDDSAQGITEVVRGVDLLDSTPRQVYLQQLLDLPTPAYAHVPILVNRSGLKLSKQTYADPVDVKNASSTLVDLLTLMNQDPPADLRSAHTSEILDWAIHNWDLSRLSAVRTIPLNL